MASLPLRSKFEYRDEQAFILIGTSTTIKTGFRENRVGSNGTYSPSSELYNAGLFLERLHLTQHSTKFAVPLIGDALP